MADPIVSEAPVGDHRQELLSRFRKAGFAAVQTRLSRPEASRLFGVPEIPGARELARRWLIERMERDRRRRRRMRLLLMLGGALTLAVVAAVLFLPALYR